MVHQVPSQEIRWKKREFPLVVVAENIHSPANMGMIIRLCESFGVRELYFCGAYGNYDSEKFRKAARSAEKYLQVTVASDTISLLQGLRMSNHKIVALEITNKSRCITDYQISIGEKIVLLIGSERHGISELSLQMAEDTLHIEQYGRTGSLNVGTALSIALYDFTTKFKNLLNEEL